MNLKKIGYKNFFLISIGAIPAAVLRWQIKHFIIVNIIGCFLFGIVNSLNISKRNKLIFGFAFCGSLTTFSGLILYLSQLISDGFYLEVLLHSISIIFIGLLAFCFGNLLANRFLSGT